MLDAAGWMRGSDGVRQEGQDQARVHASARPRATRRAILSEQIMQQQLEKIGVKLTIKNSPDILDIKIDRLRLRDDDLRLGRLVPTRTPAT